MHLPQFKQRTADSHDFAMVPRSDVPRSAFRMKKTLKSAFDAGYLVPFFCEEALPGDTFNCRATIFARLSTPIFPFMDNLYLESFFFFVPNRLVWENWVRFMGEQDDPASSISYTVPVIVSPVGGYAVSGLFDYFGLPNVGQVGGAGFFSHSCLPMRAYNLIWNTWFRDENLQNSVAQIVGDGPDTSNDYTLLRRGKRHDYFTSCLPWTQKGGVAVSLPLGTTAPVKTAASNQVTGVQEALKVLNTSGAAPAADFTLQGAVTTGNISQAAGQTFGNTAAVYPSNLYADLSAATAATINALRLAFQTQRFLEKDARGGTRYTELVRSHFGVVSPDARLQRPEYLGGGKSAIVVNPIVQTGQTGLTGGSTALGTLSGVAAVVANHGFTQSFTEHGYIIGLLCVDADLTYQQGLRRHWSRSTRYDFYWPVFQALGEQAVLNKEIYCRGDANDDLVFGYQERYAEYRFNPSEITGLMRSTAASTIDPWHLSQKFTALPTLNTTFIQSTPPLSRVLAVGAGANGQQLIMDAFFDIHAARPLPMYSVPGLVDHF